MIRSNISYIINESIGEPVDFELKEDLNGKPVGEAILQTANEKNRNGRFYSREELFPQLTAPRTVELLKAGYLRAEMGHPLSKDLQRQATIDDTKTCARFLKLWTEGDDIHTLFTPTNGPLGVAFGMDMREHCLPAWSLRALGSVEQTARGAEVRNLRVITWDNVIFPSHPGAYTVKYLSESATGESKESHTAQLIKENYDLMNSSNNSDEVPNKMSDKEITDMNESGISIPITNDSVIKFIQNESNGLKFVRECFDFIYSGINVNEAGTKVTLTESNGNIIVVNLENFIHQELMNYAANHGNRWE